MRLALVISSDYAENTVVPKREAFQDTSSLFAERIALDDAGFEVRLLPASRELPETLENLLKEQLGRVESLLVHFSGYVAVKADRGPALLLDGSRLRAFPLSRLRAAIEEGAQQSLVIIDGLAVVDGEQPSTEVAKTVCESLASPDGSVTSIVGIEEEWPTHRRGPLRLTDLFSLALAHLARKTHGGIVTSTAAFQCMQGDVLAFASIPGLDHRSGYFDFVLLQGPGVGGQTELSSGLERTTQPVPVFHPPVPTARSPLPSIPGSTPSQDSHVELTIPRPDSQPLGHANPESVPPDSGESASVDESELIGGSAETERTPSTNVETAPIAGTAPTGAREGNSGTPDEKEPLPLTFPSDQKLVRSPEGRSPTLAETPQARATFQRDWLSEAAYFPSAPPPRVSPVKPTPMRHPQATIPGLHDGEASPIPPPAEPAAPPAVPSSSPSSTRSSRPTYQPLDPATAANSHAVIALYEELLENLDASEDPRRAEVHAKLGDALRDTQRRAEALFAYERALDIDPHQESAFDGACALYRDERDYAGLVSTIRRKLDASRDENLRLSLLDLITHVWRNEARDIPRAIDTIEERLAITPEDVDCLERLIEAEDIQQDLFGRLESRERLARIQNADPELRAALYVEAATISHDEIDDLARTFIHLESALDLGVRTRETLDATEALLGGRDRWLEVIELYERALEIVADPDLAVAVAKRLVQLVIEQGSQDALKPDSLSTLIRLAEDNHELGEAVGRLVRAQTVGPETLDVAQSLRFSQPRDHALLHHLFQLAYHHHPDIAANVASVLFAEGAVTEQENEYATWLTSDSLPTPQRALENADYDALVFPTDFDRDMAFSLDKLDQSLILADVFVLKNSIPVPKDAPVLDPETSTVTLARSFLWTSRLLAVAIPELSVVADAAAPLKLLLTETRPRIIVSKSLGSGFSLTELAYLAARHTALLLPGFAIRDHSADPRMLGSALYVLSAIVNGGNRGLKTLGEYEQKLGKRLFAQLEKSEALLAEASRLVGSNRLSQSECEDRAFHWLRAVDQIRLRVALLACGSPAVAMRLNRDYPLDGSLTAEEQLDTLAAFAGSPEHCELRSRLGIAQRYDT